MVVKGGYGFGIELPTGQVPRSHLPIILVPQHGVDVVNNLLGISLIVRPQSAPHPGRRVCRFLSSIIIGCGKMMHHFNRRLLKLASNFVSIVFLSCSPLFRANSMLMEIRSSIKIVNNGEQHEFILEFTRNRPNCAKNSGYTSSHHCLPESPGQSALAGFSTNSISD